ncbi:hypothetical protein [Baekduia sp.]|uniref:hypothetical protein n=1 Tax=Baekduia sp. TaxID=2600305 RepID=UPI002DFD46F3|nr:hypothetical protein [Baekduia sp.]
MDSGGEAASIERVLHVRGRVANHEFLRVHGDYQGTALAPLVIRQSFLFFDRIGIETAIVHAGLETGVYYWARCGFDFLKEEEREHVRAWFSVMLDALGLDFDDNLQTAYQLVNVGKETDERVSMEMLAKVFPGGAENVEVREHFESAAVGNGMAYGQEMDLGKALFLSYPRAWWGYMDLNLKAGQRVLFEVYAQSRLQQAAC